MICGDRKKLEAFFLQSAVATLLTFANLAIKVESFFVDCRLYLICIFNKGSAFTPSAASKRAGPFFPLLDDEHSEFHSEQNRQSPFPPPTVAEKFHDIDPFFRTSPGCVGKAGVISFARISFIVFFIVADNYFIYNGLIILLYYIWLQESDHPQILLQILLILTILTLTEDNPSLFPSNRS